MHSAPESFAFIGCGWLGQPLAQHCVALGHTVLGSTTRESQLITLAEQNITPLLLDLRQAPLNFETLERYHIHDSVDCIMVNIPPRRRDLDASVFIQQVSQLIDMLRTWSPKAYITFISTTSVFGAARESVDEDTPTCPNTPSGEAHVALEQYVLAQENSSVVRLAGLIDAQRHPITSIVKRPTFSSGNQVVNLVHKHDVITALGKVFDRKPQGKVLHVCAPEHPTREAYYKFAAKQRKLDFPKVIHDPITKPYGKIIHAQKTQQLLGFDYAFPSPFNMG